ncbi:hypothetical protein WICPIJ_009050 [Wickerhamomyces pijperi]|uniref:Nucleolar pre-ribosomal-associated protein 1 n=1 Tax=Wickerhamomyces pijperi TaxID=599730 RepID=A0A9P8TF49_WICPI|nr:hypothetical protein WICPIJ_009050 [Wickerhamomyces pijperi]
MSEVHPLRRANIKTVSTQNKSNAKHSKNSIVDNGAFEKLEQILKNMESKDHSDDISPILVFLSKGFSTQLIQAWSYYSHINDHSKFTSCTISLTKLIKRLSSTSVSTTSETANNGELSSAELQLQAVQSGVDIIKDILINHTKVIYRALTTLRASTVNPTLRLLNEFVVLGNGSLIDDFFSLFDFQLAVLPKLLNPTKTELGNIEGTKSKEYLSMRYCFIRFLLNFLKYANVIVRRDFIANNVKLFSSWVKHLGVIDSDSLIKLTLSQWSQYILQADSGVSKSLKIKVFNEWNVVKLLPVFHSKDPEVRSEFNQFLLRLFNDAKTGISFPSEDTWFSSTASTTASSNTITVNGKHFKCNNRIIYAVLTHLKPWDDDLQSQLTLNVLQSHGELIAPYVNYLASRGLHEPKLTSYWLGQTLLISKIIRLPLSGDITREGAKPASVSLLRELIVPSLLNRAVLMKCIHTCDVALVRQLSNQLILDSLNKLNHVITNYLDEQKYVDLKNDLIQACYLQLPDLSTVCLSLSDNYNKTPQNKILLLTSLMIIQNYVTLFNDTYNYSTVITKPYMDLISNNNNSTDAAASVSGFSNIDLVLLDQFFKLQKDQTSQFKWWIKSNGADHSLFTSLLQISTDSATSSNSGISVKIEELLHSLSSQTVIFNTSDSEKDINILKSSPIFPLLHSLQVISSSSVKAKSTLSSIYKVIDETISRAVKTPYKYLDQSNIVDRVSVFICALLEQWKYLSCEDDQSRDLAEKWLGLYLRYAVLSGESLVGVSSLLNAIDSSVVKKWLSAEESNLNDPIFQDNIDDLEYCDLITITPLNQLPSKLTATVRPTSDFDVLALFSRVNQIVSSEDSVRLKSVQDSLNVMFTQFGDFMYSYPSSITGKFSQLRFWSDLYLSHENEVGNYVSQILSDVFEQLDPSCFNSDDFSSVVVSKLSNPITAADEAVALVLAGSVWCLSGEQLRSVALNHQSEMVKIGALKTMLDRGLTLSSEEVVGFVEDVSSTEALLLVLKQFVKRDLIVFADFDALFEALIGSENSVCKEIIKQLISFPTDGADILAKLVGFVSKKNDLSLTMFIFSNISMEQYHQLPQSESLNELTNIITTHALSLLRSSNFADFSAMELSNIFTLNAASSVLSSEDRQFILEYYLSSSATATDKYTGHVTALITAIGDTSESTSMIRTWINKSILYLTKIFAEFETIPDSTVSFLVSLESLLQVSSNVTGLMNKTNLNALLEVIYTKWCHLEPALKFSAVLVSVLESTKRVKIDGKKLLQILINNEEILLLKANEGGADPKLNFLTMVNLLKLFKLDIAANSTMAIRDRLMLFYNGTTSASDLILFDVLEIIESKIGSSWIDSVYSWDLIDGLSQDDEDLVGSVRLVEKKKEGFVISLNKRFITNGLSNYQMTKPAVPSSSPSSSTTDGAVWSALETFFEQCQSLRGPDQVIYYDPLFLTLLVINNDELVKVTTVEDSSDLITKINVKKLIDFDLLQTLILNLSSTDQNLVQITIKILSAIQASLDKPTASSSTTGDSSTAATTTATSSDVHFKDSLFIKLYLTKILYTFHSNPTTPRIPLTIHLISQILPILSNPSHDLYEKAYRWVIKSPSLHANDIPLYVDITSFNSKDTIETNDVYYKNVSWLLNNVRAGLRDAEDLRLLQSRGFIEWALNLLNNPYCFISVKFLVLELLDRVVELADGAGVMGLITRYAGLLNLEQEIGKAKDTIITGSNREAKKLQKEQYLINLKQLAVKFGIVASSETTAGKRIREWTDGEVEGVVKRVVRA